MLTLSELISTFDVHFAVAMTSEFCATADEISHRVEMRRETGGDRKFPDVRCESGSSVTGPETGEHPKHFSGDHSLKGAQRGP